HPFFKRYTEVGIKEGLFSDIVGAIGRMHDTLVEAAWPELIGRSIINVRPTKEPLERFPLDSDAVGYLYAEGGATRLVGKKHSTVDIQTNVLAEASEEWTREFVEDATWNVMDNMVEKVGKALGVVETQRVLDLYGGIASGDLAGGSVLSASNAALSWSLLLALHNAVRGENWKPDVLVLHETQLHQLLNDDKFIHSMYLPSSETDIARGVIGSVLGMKVVVSTLVPNGTAYAIDTRVAAVMLLRRDITVEDWEDPKTGKYGVRATTRFGLGVLRSKAVAKMTGIKTTL
ncbi:MAG: phage major capsid protein, partial [Candidatus Bathyarchaeia archaeon]